MRSWSWCSTCSSSCCETVVEPVGPRTGDVGASADQKTECGNELSSARFVNLGPEPWVTTRVVAGSALKPRGVSKTGDVLELPAAGDEHDIRGVSPWGLAELFRRQAVRPHLRGVPSVCRSRRSTPAAAERPHSEPEWRPPSPDEGSRQERGSCSPSCSDTAGVAAQSGR
jgi:hypothetical protein